LTNNTYKRKMRKVEHEYRLRDEAGDVLHYIDFHQLQIENKQYVRKIEEREMELSMSKNSTGKCVKELNSAKTDLNNGLSSLVQLKNECEEKRAFIKELVGEAKDIKRYIKMCKASSKEIRRVVESNSEMPDAEEYILQRKTMYQVGSELKTWEKRVSLSQQGYRNSVAKKRAALRDRTNLNNDANNRAVKPSTR